MKLLTKQQRHNIYIDATIETEAMENDHRGICSAISKVKPSNHTGAYYDKKIYFEELYLFRPCEHSGGWWWDRDTSNERLLALALMIEMTK